MSDNNFGSNGLVAGKLIVVTGCSSGIGAQTVKTLKAQGANIIGVDINPSDAVDTFIKADLGEAESIAATANLIPQGIDGLCNIAGLPPTRPAPAVLKVNLVGLKIFTYQLIDKFSSGASITNLASLAGGGWPEAIKQVKQLNAIDNLDSVEAFCATHKIDEEAGRSYFLSKEALIVWTMQNRWTWRDQGIRMNAISPGPVETPILPDFIKTLGDRAEEDMRVMDRPGTPADIAPLATFLQSDGSAWIRGANIPCDGGMSSHIAMNMHGF